MQLSLHYIEKAQENTNNTILSYILIGRTPDYHFEPTIMILHIIDKLLIQMDNIYFLSWEFYCI